jgi:hypothetical protein
VGGEGSARAPTGRQSTARETELKKPWRSVGGVGGYGRVPHRGVEWRGRWGIRSGTSDRGEIGRREAKIEKSV